LYLQRQVHKLPQHLQVQRHLLKNNLSGDVGGLA